MQLLANNTFFHLLEWQKALGRGEPLGQQYRTPSTTGSPIGSGPKTQQLGLSKTYGKRLAVRGLNLEVARGEVFGFLGPNGAGKTTTIRMLLNLIKPTFGEVKLFGQSLTQQSAGNLLPRVGALIEQPAFQSYLSGRDNLIAVGGYTGSVELKRVDEVLHIVGLGERGKDRYSTYSLGMRQRLGVGAALLTDPELIILDEPGNGLDPAGIVEMRELIRRLAHRRIKIISEQCGVQVS